ncbi:MAG: HEPN domain-containing protein [Treponema sp.]|jgi:HEPN domain-containing protein|nr:HEPN domain-containing protein [Treponema sp.]
MSDINLVKEWFQHSYNNLIVAKHSFEDLCPKQIDISSYLCQQCAETALKGYLVFKDIEPPKIHNLRMLCQLCIDIDDSFNTIISFCVALNKYSVISRYPNELETDETTAKLSIEKAKTIYEFCLEKIPEEGKPIHKEAAV